MGCCITKQSVEEGNQKQSEENKCSYDANNSNHDNNKIENKEKETIECIISPLTENILNNVDTNQSSKAIQDNDTDIELELDCNLSKLNLKSDLDSEVFDISTKESEFVEREQSEHDLKKSKHFSQLGLACVKNNHILDHKKTRISSSRATSPVPIISISP